MRMDRCWRLPLVGAPLMMVAMVGRMAAAQDAATPAPQNATGQVTTPQIAVPQVLRPADATPKVTVAAKAKLADKKEKAKKVEYTGPNTVIVLPPTPMLDGEGKQRLDPDGNPMFNPAYHFH